MTLQISTRPFCLPFASHCFRSSHGGPRAISYQRLIHNWDVSWDISCFNILDCACIESIYLRVMFVYFSSIAKSSSSESLWQILLSLDGEPTTKFTVNILVKLLWQRFFLLKQKCRISWPSNAERCSRVNGPWICSPVGTATHFSHFAVNQICKSYAYFKSWAFTWLRHEAFRWWWNSVSFVLWSKIY